MPNSSIMQIYQSFSEIKKSFCISAIFVNFAQRVLTYKFTLKIMKRHIFLTSLLALTMAAGSVCAQDWQGTWATAVEWTGPSDMPAASLSNRSVRMIIHVSTGGNTLRLQLSNTFGSSDTDIRSVYVADAGDAQQIDAKTAKYLTFNGKKNVTLKKGESLYSDEFAYNLKPLQLLSITINYGDQTPEHATSHRGSRTTSYIISGESKPKSYYDPQEKVDHWYNIASLEVKTTQKFPVIAALGNSITDGRGTTTNKQNRWTDFLAEGLGGKVGVLNLGIGGNAVIKGGLSEPALKRFDRDILGQQGVTSLIIFEGVNDIGGAKNDSEQRANDLIAAYREMMAKAHNKGIKVYLGTITPFKGNGYYTIFHEAARQYVNDWIRNCKECDGIIDFDALVRDPNDPAKLKAEFSNDWLHLNPKGYEAMGKLAAEKLK